MDGNIMLRRATDCDGRIEPYMHRRRRHRFHNIRLNSTDRRNLSFPFAAVGSPSTRNARQQEIGKYEKASRTHDIIRRACRPDDVASGRQLPLNRYDTPIQNNHFTARGSNEASDLMAPVYTQWEDVSRQRAFVCSA